MVQANHPGRVGKARPWQFDQNAGATNDIHAHVFPFEEWEHMGMDIICGAGIWPNCSGMATS